MITDTGAEITLRNVKINQYDLQNAELDFGGDLDLGFDGIPEGNFSGSIAWSALEAVDENQNQICDFFEVNEVSASVMVTGFVSTNQ